MLCDIKKEHIFMLQRIEKFYGSPSIGHLQLETKIDPTWYSQLSYLTDSVRNRSRSVIQIGFLTESLK